MNFRADSCVSGATTDIAIWSQVEQGLAITSCSLPALQPLLRKAVQKLGFSSASRGGASGYPAVEARSRNRKSKALSEGPRLTLRASDFDFTLVDDGDSTAELKSLDHHDTLNNSCNKSEEIVQLAA